MNRNTAQLTAMLKPYPADEMHVYPVDPRVNVVKNDDEQLVSPLQ